MTVKALKVLGVAAALFAAGWILGAALYATRVWLRLR